MALTDTQNGQPHVVALPSPFEGHIYPLFELSLRLAAEGIAVSFLNIPHYHLRMAHSLQALLHGRRLPIRFFSLSEAYPPPPDLREPGSLEACFHHISTTMGKEVEDVMHTLMTLQDDERPLPTCLIADVRIPFAQHLADKFSMARIAFWTQSAASFSYHAAVAEGFQSPPSTDDLAVIDCIPGVPSHTVQNAPTIFQRKAPKMFQHKAGNENFIFDFVMRPIPAVKDALGLVINTLEWLEPEAMAALRKHGWNPLAVGPLLPLRDACASMSLALKHTEEGGGGGKEKHMCLNWLDAQRVSSVLYISFGTLAYLHEAEFEELALGIEASEQSFIWSLRPGVVRGDTSAFMEAFKQRTQGRGLVVPWVPQLEVLSHASIGGFMTHCGWNSVLESMCRGVPMIGWPKFGDQEINVICLVDGWKVGLAMEGAEAGSLQRHEVERKVRKLFAGPQAEELRRSAERVRDAAMCATLENGTSWANLKLVLNLIRKEREIDR